MSISAPWPFIQLNKAIELLLIDFSTRNCQIALKDFQTEDLAHAVMVTMILFGLPIRTWC